MKKVGEKLVPKTEDEFDVEDIKKVENYAKAINMLYYAVNPDDYHKISCCTTAKEMWDKLEVTYEGTDHVRKAKIDFLIQEYEMFKMKEGKKIDDMFDQFSKIINDVHALKKTYANKDLKGIALKATKETEEEVSSDDDNEFGLVIKKFHKFMTKEFERKGRKHDGPPKCYGCGEIGHIKQRCPRGKNGKDKPGFKKQRAYISWGGDSGDESTDREEDEAVNLCLMAHEVQIDDVQETKDSKKKGTTKATTSAPQPFPYLDGSFLEFGSEEELTRFLTHFAKRPMSPPRVLLELFPLQKGYHELENQLQASGLWPFVSKSRTSYNPAFVRAFYSNLHRDRDTIYSSINLYDIEIDFPTFAQIAGLPIRGDDIATYGGDDWILNNEAVVIRELGITNLIHHGGAPTIHSAPLEKRLLLYILTRILRPRDSSHTSLFNEYLKAIHANIHGAYINWAKFVMILLADCASLATERRLSYAFLVMDLIVSADIHIVGPSTKMTKLWIIADNTLKKNPETEMTQDRVMDWTLQCQHHDMTAFFRGINNVTPPFDSTILGQNFKGGDKDDDSYAPSSSPNEADFVDAVDGEPIDVEDDDDDEDADS
ncbi:unnamed protein product [Cuscuta campestris]|uniref:CCHC-type domain-containing protein n=1 Tax=Cuscuta campestris TaxID=132261 RepID=A0A484MTZ5_9ASTE|nr:unnamed protein product [Cuscuta campestris]